MIYNRTQSDVDSANQLRETKVKTLQTLTDDDIAILEKGFLTYNTLNRIENKQEELKNLLAEMGYYCTNVTNKEWQLGDMFTDDDFQRIIDNENLLRKSFFVRSDTPATPNISYYFEDINALEKILNDLDIMINDVKSNYRICGDFYCGGD